MVRVKSGGGGGYGSKGQTNKRAGVKVEPTTHRGNISGITDQGLAVAYKKQPITSGKGYEPSAMPPTGVKGTYNSATQGPGSQRTVHPQGSQAEYNPGPTPMRTNPMSPTKDTLREFGPESPTSRARGK